MLAKASGQSVHLRLTLRFREQARFHKDLLCSNFLVNPIKPVEASLLAMASVQSVHLRLTLRFASRLTPTRDLLCYQFSG